MKRIKYVGVVGSGKYKRRDIVKQKLEELTWNVDPKILVIVSGHSPRNPYINKNGKKDYDNVDIWAEKWAYENCEQHPRIHPPLTPTRNGFFSRNKLIAEDSQVLFVFINLGQLISGAWNTVKHFLQKQQGTGRHGLHVFDENGKEWKQLPHWTKKYMR